MSKATGAVRRRVDHGGRSPVGRLVAASAALVAAGVLGAGAAGAGAGAAGASAPRASGRTAVVFQPIREVWANNAVAHRRDVAALCRHAVSTLAMETCAEARTENLDVAIDAIRAKAFRSARTVAAKVAINRDDAAWLANRIPVCLAGYAGANGGTIVQVLVATCETAVSQARLTALQGRPAPTAQLSATANIDPTATEYATTASGTRIGAIATQGDQTGGVVISWTVIAGYKGFVVDPASFPYVDGSFVDRGVPYGHPAGHRVAPGKEYSFGVDYSRLREDPNRRSGRGRYEYRAGTVVVGAWR